VHVKEFREVHYRPSRAMLKDWADYCRLMLDGRVARTDFHQYRKEVHNAIRESNTDPIVTESLVELFEEMLREHGIDPDAVPGDKHPWRPYGDED